MATVAGQGTTYALPNYHGELFTVTPTETPFLSAIGGLNSAKKTTATTFEWQTVDRRASSANNAALEGAAAPAGTERSRSNVNNVVEIHHSAIEVSYTKIAARGQFAGANIAPQWDDAVLDELAIQTLAELESMAVDVEKSFLSGTKNVPTDNTTARKTQGLLGAISNTSYAGVNLGSATVVASTGVFTSATHGFSVGDAVYLGAITTTTGVSAGVRYYALTVPSGTTFTLSATPGGAALTLVTNGSTAAVYKGTATSKSTLDTALQGAFDNGAKLPQDSTVIIVGSKQKLALSNAYAIPALNQVTRDRTIGGVAVDTLVTDFGTFGVMLDRWMPSDQIAVTDLSVCYPVFLEIPGKGLLFTEELARTGAARKFQLYGEVGLEYGASNFHALVQGLL